MRNKRSSEEIIAHGKQLLSIKEQLGRGNFYAWLESHNIAPSTAYRYMQFAKVFGEVDERLKTIMTQLNGDMENE
jgi:hypothetical protein